MQFVKGKPPETQCSTRPGDRAKRREVALGGPGFEPKCIRAWLSLRPSQGQLALLGDEFNDTLSTDTVPVLHLYAKSSVCLLLLVLFHREHTYMHLELCNLRQECHPNDGKNERELKKMRNNSLNRHVPKHSVICMLDV
jgi:hypothetical protein